MIEKMDYYQAEYCPFDKCPFSAITCTQCCQCGEIQDYVRFRQTSFINGILAFKFERTKR